MYAVAQKKQIIRYNKLCSAGFPTPRETVGIVIGNFVGLNVDISAGSGNADLTVGIQQIIPT